MTGFPEFDLSLVDGTLLSLSSTDAAAAAFLEKFGRAARLTTGNGQGSRVLVTSQEGSLPAQNGIIYSCPPVFDQKSLFLHLFGLSNLLVRQARNGLLFHGALVEHEGRGVILFAQGGTGKTTASRRLPSPWHSLSDDLTLILRDAHGLWWAHPWPTLSRVSEGGSMDGWDLQRAVRLEALFHLNRADSERVERVPPGEAAVLLLQSAEQAFQPALRFNNKDASRSLRLQRLEGVLELVRNLPVHELYLSLTGNFWQTLENALPPVRGEQNG